MWKIIDIISWWALWVSSAGCWIAVTFFDWTPEPKTTAMAAFLALQFVSSTKAVLCQRDIDT